MLFDPVAFPCHFVYHYKPAVLYRPQLQFFASWWRKNGLALRWDFRSALASSLRFPLNAFAKETLKFLVHLKQSASLPRILLKGSLSTWQNGFTSVRVTEHLGTERSSAARLGRGLREPWSGSSSRRRGKREDQSRIWESEESPFSIRRVDWNQTRRGEVPYFGANEVAPRSFINPGGPK